jgi:hypothetical protein
MPKEKRNNLAIYTLAGSILISSVLVSMNVANSAPTDRDISVLRLDISKLRNELASYKRCMNKNMVTVQFENPKFVTSCR